MGSSIPAGYVEVRKGVYERIDTIQKRFMGRKAVLPNKNTSRNSKPKQTVRDEPLGQDEGKKKNTGRVLVRCKIFRKRLTDPDNAIIKWHLDCLRMSKILRDDREEDVALEVTQEKTRGQEEVLIELFHDARPV